MVCTMLPWRDRFTNPTPEQLRDPFEGEAREAFDRVRKELRAFSGVQETLGWYGVCWSWVLEYRLPALEHPFAVIIPSPEDLQLAMPLDRPFIENLPIRRLKRSIRDGLDLASEPFDTNWAVWSIVQGGPPAEDLSDIVRRKFKFLAAS